MKYIAVFVLLLSALLGGEWSAPIDIFTATVVIGPVVGVDGTGNAVIIATTTPDGTTYYTNYAQLVGGSVTNSGNFGSFSISSVSNVISVNSAGNAASSWRERMGSGILFKGAVLLNGTWTLPAALSDPINFQSPFYSPGINLDSSNTALVVWTAEEIASPHDYAVQFNTYFGGWLVSPGTAFLPSPATDVLGNLVFAGSPTGQGLALWLDGTNPKVQSSYYDGSGWHANSLLSTNVNTTYAANAVAMNASNNGILLWGNPTLGINSSYFSNPFSYLTEQTVYLGGSNNTVPNAVVCLSESGVATALWVVHNTVTMDYSLFSSSSQSGGAWGPTTTLATPSTNFVQSPNIAVDGSGNVYAVWEQDDAFGNGFVYYNQYQVSTSNWLAQPILLSSLGHFQHNQICRSMRLEMQL